MKPPCRILLSIVALGAIHLAGCQLIKDEKAEPRRPNILFAISDDQSYHTSFTGSGFVQTPAFDRIAREGVLFTNCIAPAPGCAPSRSSIVTGRYFWQNEQSGQHASYWLKKHVSFVDLLEANGYATGYTGKGVAPFRLAQSANDTLIRVQNAAGTPYNEIRYETGLSNDPRPGGRFMSDLDYFGNFKEFLKNAREDKPFFFWYGAFEPHRAYKKDSWKSSGKKLEDVELPSFFPDSDVIRGDMLDYAIAIEWFDHHLGMMINYLEEIGELDNTIIIVTSDQGMPFPYAKANCNNFGLHVPFAMRYPKMIKGGRELHDLISFTDIAPTILELSQTPDDGMLPVYGKSISNILKSRKNGLVDKSRKYAFAGRERHSSSRHGNLGYPQRTIRSATHQLIWNMAPDLWPAGMPQSIIKGEPGPMLGIDKDGNYLEGTAFHDVDESPTKTYLLENWHKEDVFPYFKQAFMKRPGFELYDIINDPGCMRNLAGDPGYVTIRDELLARLMEKLTETNDPRIVGPDKGIFDSYPRFLLIREFPEQAKADMAFEDFISGKMP